MRASIVVSVVVEGECDGNRYCEERGMNDDLLVLEDGIEASDGADLASRLLNMMRAAATITISDYVVDAPGEDEVLCGCDGCCEGGFVYFW